MFVDKINKFLPEYENIERDYFLNLLEWSNVWFDIYKLEKDFLLTLILIKFWQKYPDLVFKWWTCLNKVYFDYFRLSEDLDFVVNIDWWRDTRKKIMKNYEIWIIDDLKILWMKIKEERTKYDEYKLAMFTFFYNSVIDNSEQLIKIDISAKNKLQLAPKQWKINTIFYDEIYNKKVFDERVINCIDIKEALAEKIRACLTIDPSAIRDFFDIRYAKNCSDFDFSDDEFKSLVDEKLKESSYDYHIDENKELLFEQIKKDLNPVLNKHYDFNLNEVIDFIDSFKVVK